MKAFINYINILGISLLFLSCTSRGKTIVVNFDNSEKKIWAIEEINAELPKDWTNYEFLTFDIYATSPQRFSLVLHDEAGKRRITVLPFQNAWVRPPSPSCTFKKET